jgi:hypothetical protein
MPLEWNGHITPLMTMVDREDRKRILALYERAARRDGEVAELSSTVSRLAATVEAIRACLGLPSPALLIKSLPTPAFSVPAIKELRTEILVLMARLALLPPVGFDSLIVADFPALLTEFRGKRFRLMWRGSRHGFSACAFHRRCDGPANTLTLIQDTEGNIFGGFTPVKWKSHPKHSYFKGSRNNRWKADPSLNSFLFTLKNPHNFPARKFALRAEKNDKAIRCAPWGPHFSDIGVSDNCNTSTRSWSDFREAYANDTGLDGRTVLTGSLYFTVKEIEVLEIAD